MKPSFLINRPQMETANKPERLLPSRRLQLHNGFYLWLLVGWLMLSPKLIQAQIYDGTIELTTQQEVNAFNYIEVTGILWLNGPDITSVEPLSNLTKVGEVLQITNTGLSSLSGLQNLASCGYLFIGRNPALNNLVNLYGLVSVDDIFIQSNNALSSLTGLENVTYLRNLSIHDNSTLSSLTGLENVTYLQTLSILGNNALSSLTGLGNITSLQNLSIQNNNALTSLNSLGNLIYVNEGLTITGNMQLSQCCILKSIIEAVTLENINIQENADGCNSQDEIQELCTPPPPISIETQPEDATSCVGGEVTFSVEATGMDLSYTWQKDGNVIDGAIGTSYTIKPVSLENSGSYNVVVTGQSASVTSNAAILTVNPLPNSSITVIPTSNEYTGGNPNIIYLGYGPQSVELQASGGVSYLWSPVNDLNDPTIANPVFAPTIAGSYTFTVTVTNSTACNASSFVTIKVIDVRSGKNKEKVTICHKGKDLSVDPILVPGHLAHGDILGNCSGIPLARVSNESGTVEIEMAIQPVLKNFPNPFSGQTTIEFALNQEEEYNLEIFDVHGRLIKHLNQGKTKAGKMTQVEWQALQVPAGLYIVRLTTATSIQQLRLLVK